jgi:hypothetical protein
MNAQVWREQCGVKWSGNFAAFKTRSMARRTFA